MIALAKSLQYLEDIDVGSTNITGDTLRELVASCLNLRAVNITGCKKLNARDDLVLRNHKINYDGGEDVFRFHLTPDYNSDLPKITHSVLKTRSTLSLHKVYRYLIKKLQEANVEEYLDDAPVEESIVILCNGFILETSLQLREVKERPWPYEERLLTLNYRRKDTLPKNSLNAPNSRQPVLNATAATRRSNNMMMINSNKQIVSNSFASMRGGS